MIKDGPEFSIGSKDRPVQISQKGTIRRLKWISTKFVLLWDTLDERGWLVNGTSALLHVVRASLFHASKDPFRSAFLFRNTDMEEAETPFTANSAVEVLISKHNRNLRLYEDDDEEGGHILLKTQIDHFYSLLEKLIDHQADVSSDDNRQLPDRPRRYLEGWDFEDLVTDCDPLRPRVATIQPIGKGWVDFVRDIHAVVLLGRGFGDIIRPSGTGLCEYWVELPKNQFYIASCLSDLERLSKAYGGQDDHEWVTSNLICHTPSTPFIFCQCKGGIGRDHGEPVQTLFPSAMCEALRPNVHQIELRGPGAIIFGHNSTFPWIWGDTGLPVEGELGGTDAESNSIGRDTDSFKDSGIGFSPGPSTKRTVTPSSMTNTRSVSESMSELLMRSMGEESIAGIEKRAYTRDRYTVGIICALSKELLAVRVLFDSRHSGFKTGVADSNHYALGEIAGHLVVAACLPAGEYGTNSAASVASNMKRSFPFIRFCLLVGIAGGAPSQKNDIRLGDVVVGLPTGTNPGVFQYDLGKSNEDNSFYPTSVLQRPPRVLTNAINALQSDPELRTDPLGPHLDKIINDLPEYGYPGSELDVLVPSCGNSCESRQIPDTYCPHVRQRAQRATNTPVIHYGLIASGNRVVKNAAFRDQLTHEHGALCFEMEAAGIINTIDCLVIRGICDYCDGVKIDTWQEYAAATAAAYAKLLLSAVAPVEEDNVDESWRSGDEPRTKKRRWMS
jgi:nucleoside phosphorylase